MSRLCMLKMDVSEEVILPISVHTTLTGHSKSLFTQTITNLSQGILEIPVLVRSLKSSSGEFI